MLRRLDRSLLVLMRTRGHWPPLERAVSALSRSGEQSRLWLAISGGGILSEPGRRRTYVRLGVTICAAEVGVSVAKLAVRRPRPVLEGLPQLCSTASQRSCPSSHAATAFAAARVLSEVHPPPPLYATAAAMALSRPYLGVHYPSDVLLGMAAGLLCAEMTAKMFVRLPI